MKRVGKSLLIVCMFLIFCVNIYAESEVNTKIKDKNIEAIINDKKIKEHKKLEESGEIKEIEKKVDEYYKKNKDKIITSSDFIGKSDVEKKELSEIIEKSKLENDKEISVKSRGSNDMSWDYFDHGDIVLVHDGWVIYGYYRHGGTYDENIDACRSAQLG